MFHIGRCGSKVLVDLVKQHPQVLWEGEIYYRYANMQKVGPLSLTPGRVCKEGKEIFQLRIPLSGKRCYGFEVQLHLLDPLCIILPEYLQLLHSYKFTHFIILKRKNYLRKTLSSLIAKKNGLWHQLDTEKQLITRINLDMNNIEIKNDNKPLFAFFDEWDNQFRLLKEKLKEYENVLHLTYEDDIKSDPSNGYRKICNFLGLKPHNEVFTRYVRTNPFRLEDIIINYDEVRAYFNGTRYEWMLNE